MIIEISNDDSDILYDILQYAKDKWNDDLLKIDDKSVRSLIQYDIDRVNLIQDQIRRNLNNE